MRFVIRLGGREVFALEHERAPAAEHGPPAERPVLEAGSGGLFDADGLDFPRPDEVKLGFHRTYGRGQ